MATELTPHEFIYNVFVYPLSLVMPYLLSLLIERSARGEISLMNTSLYPCSP